MKTVFRLICICILCAAMDIACLAEEGILTVYFIDVGQADSTIIQCDEGVLMIDGGNVADSQLIFSLLRNTLGIQHIDYACRQHHQESGKTAGRVCVSRPAGHYLAETEKGL